MNNKNYDLSLIAYYLSEYDMDAVLALGYKTRNAALKDISVSLGKPNNYLKLRRDEFDVLTSSTRRGWINRPPTKEVTSLFAKFSNISFDDLTLKIIHILQREEKIYKSHFSDAVEDKAYIESVHQVVGTELGAKVIRDKPVSVKKPKNRTGVAYRRDPFIAANALCNAEYKCEVCPDHETFIRKSNGKTYTEPHHLIPIKYQSRYNVSLDVENNIVSLCSNCHNKLHYGADIRDMLFKLYNNRQELLKKVGIEISFAELEGLYK